MPFLNSTFSEALEIGIIGQLELLDPVTALDLKIKQTEEKLEQFVMSGLRM